MSGAVQSLRAVAQQHKFFEELVEVSRQLVRHRRSVLAGAGGVRISFSLSLSLFLSLSLSFSLSVSLCVCSQAQEGLSMWARVCCGVVCECGVRVWVRTYDMYPPPHMTCILLLVWVASVGTHMHAHTKGASFVCMQANM